MRVKLTKSMIHRYLAGTVPIYKLLRVVVSTMAIVFAWHSNARDEYFVAMPDTIPSCSRSEDIAPECSGGIDQTLREVYNLIKNRIDSLEESATLGNSFRDLEKIDSGFHVSMFDEMGVTLCEDEVLHSCALHRQSQAHGINLYNISPIRMQKILLYIYFQSRNYREFETLLVQEFTGISIDLERLIASDGANGIRFCTGENYLWFGERYTKKVFWGDVEDHRSPIRDPLAYRVDIAICESKFTESGVNELYMFSWYSKKWIPISDVQIREYARHYPEFKKLRKELKRYYRR